MVLKNENANKIPVYNSYTGEIIGTVPQSTKQDVLRALDVAKIGEAIGKKMPATERIVILKKTVTIMEREFNARA